MRKKNILLFEILLWLFIGLLIVIPRKGFYTLGGSSFLDNNANA